MAVISSGSFHPLVTVIDLGWAFDLRYWNPIESEDFDWGYWVSSLFDMNGVVCGSGSSSLGTKLLIILQSTKKNGWFLKLDWYIYLYTRWKCSPESALKWIVQGFQQFHTANDVSCSYFEWGEKISAFLHLFADLLLTRERILEIKLLQVPNDSNPFTTCDEMETLVCKGCPSRGSWTSELNSTREHEEPQSRVSSAQHSSLDSQGWVCRANAVEMIQQPKC